MGSWADTRLSRLLGTRLPLICAPMANGPSTPALAAAVSAAGGLGSLALAGLPPGRVRETIAEVRCRTDTPFGVNLFFHEPARGGGPESAALFEPFRRELGLPSPPPRVPVAPVLEDVLEVVLEERPPVFSFTFGAPPAELVSALREGGTRVLGTATTVREAQALEALGVDAVVAQGAEAGGHRGTFSGPFEAALVGTLALVPAAVDAVGVPVVAAGGIMDGRGIAAALALGAAGAQLGTAFLACPESGTHPAHKRAVLEGTEETTVVTAVLTGRPARAVRNRLVEALEPHAERLAPYPLQAELWADVRAEAAARGESDLLPLLAGQGLRLAREGPAAELVAALAEETEAVLARLAGQPGARGGRMAAHDRREGSSQSS